MKPISNNRQSVCQSLIEILNGGLPPNESVLTPRPTTDEIPAYVEPTLFSFAHDVFTCPNGNKIYIGPKIVSALRAKKALLEANVVGIVNCTTRVPSLHRPDIRYCHVPVTDESKADISVYFDGATYFMENILKRPGGGSVLVHCEQGMSRSSSVVIAYLMRYHNMTRDEAYLTCKKKRPMICPNSGFWDQLQVYETKLNSERQRQVENDNRLTQNAPGTCTTTITTTTYAKLEEPSLMTDSIDIGWALQSSSIFSTCKELSNHDLCQNSNLIGPLCTVETLDQKKQLLFVCLDFVWGRGNLDIDMEWFAFIYEHACDRSLGDDSVSMDDLLKDLLYNQESQFLQFWGGEVFLKDIERLLAAVNRKNKEH